MRIALEAGILAFNVESRAELVLLDQVAGSLGRRAPVSLRINPDVDAETHPYISTGLKKNKFGIPAAQSMDAFREAAALPHVDVVGVDCHIGSQLTRTAPFTDAAARLVELMGRLREAGIDIRYLDIGGGLGIRYGSEEEPDPPSPAEYGAAIVGALRPIFDRPLTLICEPGRVIVGNAGTLVTRVLYNKRSEVKNFVIVDAAFNDLLRPAFYGSYHPIQPVQNEREREPVIADVVGPICETGDFLARDRELAKVEPGELLAIGAAGAYGFVMASNYNTRPRVAEVLVTGDRYAVIRRRETVDQLLENESIPEFLS
jgi:diaminopimelate decarboxylase